MEWQLGFRVERRDSCFVFNDTATTEIYTLSLHDALPITRRNTPMKELLRRLAREDDGVSAIEYGLIAGLAAVVLIGALALTGTSLQSIFNTIASQLESVASGAGSGSG